MDHDISKIINQIQNGEVDKWGAAEVSELLKKLGLDECEKHLSGVDGDSFIKIDDFKSLGVPSKYIERLTDIQSKMNVGNQQTIRKKKKGKTKKEDNNNEN